MKNKNAFVDEIKKRPDVHLIEVTKHNRNSLKPRLTEILNQELTKEI